MFIEERLNIMQTFRVRITRSRERDELREAKSCRFFYETFYVYGRTYVVSLVCARVVIPVVEGFIVTASYYSRYLDSDGCGVRR